MRNLFSYLGTALVISIAAKAETTTVKGITTDYVTAGAVNADQYQNFLFENHGQKGGDKKFASEEDQSIMNPSNVITVNAEKAMEEIIAEDNKIIDSKVTYDGSLIFIGKTIEEIIADDNKIIESKISDEVYPIFFDQTVEDVIEENNDIIENPAIEAQPLDFKIINRNTITKQNNTLLIGMK